MAELKAESDALKLTNATTEVDALVHSGRILPAQRDAMLELSMSNREMFDRLVPENPIVSLSEDGVTTHDAPESNNLDAEVERLSATAMQAGPGRKK